MAPMQLKVWPRASTDWDTKRLVDDQPEGLQQKVKGVAAGPTAKRVGDTHLSGKADGLGSPRIRLHFYATVATFSPIATFSEVNGGSSEAVAAEQLVENLPICFPSLHFIPLFISTK